jgi:hypothetical protein
MSGLPSHIMSAEYRATLAEKGEEIYNDTLKPLLEPSHNKEYIAIHVDSEDYAIARSAREAARALLMRHPIDGRIFSRRIGSEPETGSLARMLAGEVVGAGYQRPKE